MPPKRPSESSSGSAKKRRIGSVQPSLKEGSLDFFFKRKTDAPVQSSSNCTATSSTHLIEDEKVAQRLAEDDGIELGTVLKLEQEWKTSVLPRTKQPNIEVIDVDELPDGRVSAVKRKLNILSSSLLLLQFPLRVLSIEIHFRAIRRIRNLIRKLL